MEFYSCYPNKANVLITNKCNLLCKHCYVPHSNQDITLEDFSIILDRFKELKIKNLYIEGGEPTIHHSFDKICNLLQDKDFHLGIVSNCTCLDYTKANILGKTFHSIQVSIDGCNQEEYESIRGVGTYSKLKKGLNLLKNYNKKLKINYVFTKFYDGGIENLFNFAIEFGINKIRIIHVVDFSKVLNPSNLQTEKFIKEIIYLKRKFPYFELELVFPYSLINKFETQFNTVGIKNWYGICYASTTYFVIDQNQFVYPCNFLVKEVPLFKFTDTGSFINEWKNDLILRKLRNNQILSQCKNCPASIS